MSINGRDKKRRILITGGAGFIGYHLARKLSQDPAARLVLVDNFVRGNPDHDLAALVSEANVELISGDLTNPATFAKLGADFDEIYHLAAIIGVSNVIERPHEVLRVNAISTLLLLDWFGKGGGKKLLFSSTSEAYAWTQKFYALPIPTPEDIPLSLTDPKNPRSSYAGSKIFGELAVAQYSAIYNKPFVIVRYHNVYGPRMGNDHVIPQLYERALNGQNPLTVYSASHRRAFCYVSDAVDATVGAMREDRANGQTINVGNDLAEVTIGELAQQLLAVANIKASLDPQTAVNDPVIRRCPDLARAREVLGYRPSITLEVGLRQTLKWYARHFGSRLSDKAVSDD